MKILFASHKLAEEELGLAADITNSVFKNSTHQVINAGVYDHTLGVKGGDHLVLTYSSKEGSNSFYFALKEVYEYSDKKGIDLAIFSDGPTWPLEASTIDNLIDKKDILNFPVSIRKGRAAGRSLTYNSKFPFLDTNFIILNIPKIKDLGVLEGSPKFYSHFYSWAQNHATFYDFIEGHLNLDQLGVYSDQAPILDAFGENKEFLPSYFWFDPELKILTSYPFDERTNFLRFRFLKDLDIELNKKSESYLLNQINKNFKVARKREGTFLAPPLSKRIFSSVHNFLNVFLGKKSFEVQKKYFDDPKLKKST